MDTESSVTMEKTLSDEAIIEIIDMHKWFGDFHVLQGINLTVHKQERIVICGPSGSGKSTLPRWASWGSLMRENRHSSDASTVWKNINGDALWWTASN